MFSVRTTLGAITIIIADAIICYIVFLLTFFPLFDIPVWLSSGRLYNQPSPFLFTMIVVLSLSLAHLYSFMEYIYPIDLLKRIITSFLVSLVSIATLGYFSKGFTSLHWKLLPSLVVIYVCLFAFRWFLFFALRKNRTRILILGANEQARMIVKESQKKKIQRLRYHRHIYFP